MYPNIFFYKSYFGLISFTCWSNQNCWKFGVPLISPVLIKLLPKAGFHQFLWYATSILHNLNIHRDPYNTYFVKRPIAVLLSLRYMKYLVYKWGRQSLVHFPCNVSAHDYKYHFIHDKLNSRQLQYRTSKGAKTADAESNQSFIQYPRTQKSKQTIRSRGSVWRVAVAVWRIRDAFSSRLAFQSHSRPIAISYIPQQHVYNYHPAQKPNCYSEARDTRS